MTILAFDSSSLSASAAVTRDGALLAQSFQNNGLTHSQTLMPMAEALLRNAGLALTDVDLIAVTHGPGSFTGLRIGVAAANGLAWGLGRPCLGVSSLAAAAQGVAHWGGLICAVQDARRGEVYNALFLSEGGALTRLTEDRALPLAALWAEMQKKNPILVGDGAELCYNGRGGEAARLAPPHLRFPCAWAVAHLAASHPDLDRASYATPVYIRASGAERTRRARSESPCG
ncbi:MAG: tRNA (adenosine(37)-N6)-threonylcarbamoyltransferase complex dimerization subunit type 1 TsaB [Oscillospiraceae bacterium]|jgi:tRNA threonylcarbamoyladenosine biosynthesis protein TsaB|nr:tRNA (adenosine(37)-N6)-threonylcarbamoyltransferase complex dimerization subunit type 1 TsaB [Oscillospiraceae bacterium]